jgi:hypothetical protein
MCIYLEELEVAPKKGAAQKRKSPVTAKSAVKKGGREIFMFGHKHICNYICIYIYVHIIYTYICIGGKKQEQVSESEEDEEDDEDEMDFE